jgi:NAD(P)-dependent dehydrogenase (short-subunit alcohol dehydrogenase family)
MQPSRTIILTGCSRGLGRALVPEFIARGHTVAGCSRSKQAIADLSREFPEQGHFQTLDICDEQAVAAWSDATVQKLGAPHLIINNAALINKPAPLWQISRTEFQQIMDVNLVAVHTVIRHYLPSMIDHGLGTIINLSSGWGRSVSPAMAPYCASKYAIEGLTRALSEDLPSGLAAIALNPGVIDTPMLRDIWGAAAAAYPDAEQWATIAAPYMLSLGVRENGQSLTVPD